MTARQAAYEALNEIIIKSGYSNLVVKRVLAQSALSQEDKAFAASLIYTTLERLITIDWHLDRFIKRKTEPKLLNIIRMGVCQLLYMNSVPAYSAVDESVKLARSSGYSSATGFVNFILRSVERERASLSLPNENDKVLRLSIEYSFPQWLVSLWIDEYGYDIAVKLLSHKAENTTALRINTMQTTPEAIASELDRLGITWKHGVLFSDVLLVKGLDIDNFTPYKLGFCTVQSEGSMIAALCADAQSGNTFLDCCAAPGGKSVYIAQLMGDSGKVVAWDNHEGRVELIRANARRMGIKSISAYKHDATIVMPQIESKCDAVLVDAPCSGLGMVWSKPEIRNNKTMTDIDGLCLTQRSILNTAARHVRIGGRLVYSTCTLSRRENKDIVKAFLSENTDFEPAELPKGLPAQIYDGSSYIELLPHIHGIEGFFVAVMRRKK